MTQEEILEGNKLIAEFMGGVYYPDYELMKLAKSFEANKCQTYKLKTLKFHSSWNWLMSVVEKIDQLEIVDYFSILFNHSSDIQLTNVKISDYDNNFYQHIKGDENTIDVVYKTTVEFIKWYNLKTK